MRSLKYLSLVFGMIAMLALTACSKKDSGSVAAPAAQGTVVPTGVLQPNDIRLCFAGQIHTVADGCMNQQTQFQTCPHSHGWSFRENRCVLGTIVTDQMLVGIPNAERFGGTLEVTYSHDLNQLLRKYTRACGMDDGWNNSYWSQGFRCWHYTRHGVYVEVTSYGGPNRAAQIRITAGRDNRLFMSFPATVSDYGSGMQVVALGGSGVVVDIPHGRFGTNAPNYRMYLDINGEEAGRGTLLRR